MLRRTILSALAVGLSFSPRVYAQEHQHGAEQLGTVNFPVSCNAEAQKRMNRAVAMLHSFWFTEGRRAFESVVEADPGCGIAYWGVALSYFGNPMAGGGSGPSQASGWEAAQKAASVGGRSERDRAYIDAALALYRDHDKLDNRTRLRAYEQALKSIVERYPDDDEAKIFHGIIRVANAPPTDLTFAQQQDAAKLLTEMYRKQPKHPGLAHYIIHAFDSPPLAHLALEAARQYAEIAPAAPHAAHMPSHTFTRLGYWDESIKANRKSADLEPPGSKAHAGDYMVYAYLQQGRDEAARKVIEEVGGTSYEESRVGALSSYSGLAMLARYALERGEWAAAAALKVTSGPPSAEAVTHFAKALGAARSNNLALAKTELAELERMVAALNAANDREWAHRVDAQRIAVSAWIAHLEGKHADAVRLAREAADKEDQVEKHPITPGPLLPARELLGDILMLHRQPADALVAYEATLKKEPNRARTIYGAAQAANAAGKRDVAKQYYTALIKLMDPASTRRELQFAKMFVSEH
jgi:hypothetical protein